ncbi:50S ribosomal protein L13 [Candidatus Woesearchaeota archaeon]|nr:50S ribosomal protein L13 [Candidatus Woesearchaeota archaeon]
MADPLIYDASGMIVGRLATVIAKQAILGKRIIIVNCESAVIVGKRETVLGDFKHWRSRGKPRKGPFFPRQSHMIVKRIIRGMLPWKRDKGREAYSRIICYIGVPKQLQGKQTIKLPKADVHTKERMFVTVGEMSNLIGGSQV